MNEKKKLLLLLVAIVALILTVVIGQLLTSKKSKVLWEKTQDIYNSKQINIIYIGRPTCGYCQKFKPVVDNLAAKYNFDYTYINTDETTTEDFNKILDILGLESDNFGTPYLAVVQNGKKLGEQLGYTDESGLFTLLQNNGVISKDIVNPYIADDTDEVVAAFNKVFNSKEKKLVYIGRPTCGYCQKISPILEEIKTEYDLNYYYVNTDEITSLQLTAILNKLGKSLSSFGTPYLAVVQNGEKLGEQPGYVEKETLLTFLRKYSIVD